MLDNALEVQQVRKKTLARNRKRKQRLAASAQDRSTELSQQRKRMRLLRDRETPARRSARLEAMRQPVLMNEHKRRHPNPGKKFSYCQ